SESPRRGVHVRRIAGDERHLRDHPGLAGLGPPLRHAARVDALVGPARLALVLLVGAGLLLRVLWRLQSVQPGFRADGLVAARIDLPASRYEKKESQSVFRRRLLDSLNAEPGIRAALVSELPMSGDALDHDALIEGAPPLAPGDEPSL